MHPLSWIAAAFLAYVAIGEIIRLVYRIREWNGPTQ